MLALLLAEADRVVSTDRLADEIWGDDRPPTAVRTIRVYVMNLRRLLGGDCLATRPGGYQLAVGDGDLDAAEFERLVAAGRRGLAGGDVGTAVTRLAEALALWRGPAMADVEAGPTVAAEAERLEQCRLGALETRLGAELDVGRHVEVVDSLRRLVEEHPLREELRHLLMVALYRCGRRAEALEVYRSGRQVLVAELGLEPAPRLRDLQRAVLTDDPCLAVPIARARSVAPAQLPPEVLAFTGREDQVERLDAIAPSGVLAVWTIAGTAGVGKTALGVHWAHRVRDRFPDGQLFVNLRGYAAGTPLTPLEVLARFLSALGVPAEKIPSDLEQAAAMYRSVLADKRVLVLLDNASHADQVRPLLPGTPGCLVVVTSRDRLPGLVASNGARQLDLEVLTPAESRMLLARLLGADRVRAEPDAVAELARLCGHLPLALRIAAANLSAHTGVTITRYAASLSAGDRLAALQVPGDAQAGVRVAFDHSYAALPSEARRLFRLLGLVPGADITAPAAAALAGVPESRAAPLLRLLSGAHLVDEHATGRFALHDLLRLYARERGTAEDDRRAALDRLFTIYLNTVSAVSERLYPHVMRLPVAGGATIDVTDDLAWLDAERANLVAAVSHAAAHGPYDAAWRLADALHGYLFLGMHTVHWEVVGRAGLAAAEADDRPDGQASAHISLAETHFVHGRYRQAIRHHTLAVRLSRRAGWPDGESRALCKLGFTHLALGQLDQAAGYCTRALAIDRRTGQLARQAHSHDNLGAVYETAGRLDLAHRHFTEGLALYRRIGSRSGEGRTLAFLAETLRWQGRLDEALDALLTARALSREVGDRYAEHRIARLLAAVHCDAGRHTEALDLAETALDLFRDTGNRHLEARALITLATVHEQCGQTSLARDGFRQALGLAWEVGDRYTETHALIGLATAHCQTDRAVTAATAALAAAHHGGYRLLEGNALTALAAAHLGLDRPERAFDLAVRAIAIHADTGHRIGEARAHVVAEEAQRLVTVFTSTHR